MTISHFDDSCWAAQWKVRLAVGFIVIIPIFGQYLYLFPHIANNFSWAMFSR